MKLNLKKWMTKVNRRIAITRKAGSGTISASNSSWASGTLLTATTTGIIMGYLFVRFPSNATGRRAAQIGVAGTWQTSLYATGNAVNGDPTDYIIPFCESVTEGDEMNLRVWQNSGAAQSVTWMSRYIYIPQ